MGVGRTLSFCSFCPSAHPPLAPTDSQATPRLYLLCSRGWGLCLDDPPAKNTVDFPSVPPGVLYDVGHQCRLQYGAHSAFCEDVDVSGYGRVERSCPQLPADPSGPPSGSCKAHPEWGG